MSSASSFDGISTTSVAQATTGRSDSISATSPTDAFGSNDKGEPCSPPPGEAGSSASLTSSGIDGKGGAMRVTSDTASAVSTRITTNATAATTIPATDLGDTTPRREDFTTTTQFPPSLTVTCCRVGL
ncbi:uncharacterized protein [Miscanthus floridulus]|uniref:uncharacterized protein n=1 Tax=Miscanthus floridulus TaxID=154761 RepID=UPI00345756A8